MYDVKKIFKNMKDEIEGADVTFINALANNYREHALVVLTFNYYIFFIKKIHLKILYNTIEN